jgi:phosphorylcholine metabolism protein LicD
MSEEKIMPTIEQSGMALVDALDILDEMDIRCMLDGGTLLGFYRDGTFAQDDHDDIDLTVSSKMWHRAEDIDKEMVARGFELYHKWEPNEERHHTGQYAWKRDSVKIDLMFKEFLSTKNIVHWTVYGGKNKVTHKCVPFEFIDVCSACVYSVPVESGKTENITCGIPIRVEEYLAYRYGDWKTPVHRKDYSCYTTDKSIVENYGKEI